MRLRHTLLASALLATMYGVFTPVIAQTTEAPIVVEDVNKFTNLLAAADLKARGITNPTQEQLAASLQSIQAKRASGMGWGEIANSQGLNFGAVVSAYRSERGEKSERAEHGSHAETHGKSKSETASSDSNRHSGSAGSSSSGGSRSGSSSGGGGGGGRSK